MVMQENTFWSRIKARRLASNVYTLIAFLVLFVVSTALYVLIPEGISGEIFIAVSTSLLATIFISFFDIYTAYKNFENSEFIDNLYRFGIHNLHFDKKDLLERLIEGAHTEIWVSGYRLILTKDLVEGLYRARKRGVNIRFLVCPPWETAHQLVYGSDLESSLDNYIYIMRVLSTLDANDSTGVIEVHFSQKPLFNDTYLVDDKIVTSPYMHNKDITHGVITAKDFFTYELDKDYRLYQLIKDEYEAVWSECNDTMDQNAARVILDELDARQFDCTYRDKIKVFEDHIEHTPGI